MSQPPEEILQILRQAERVLIAAHVFPDGDALGSQLALGNALESAGKEVYLYSEEPVSYILEFMPGSERLISRLPADNDFDCAVSLDCGDKRRLGIGADDLLRHKPFIAIDHHTGHQFFADHTWVDAQRSSTGEMIYDLLRCLDYEISKDTAYCLYTAILTDTGSFKYESTTSHTMRVAADLLDYGIKPAEICEQIFDNYSTNRLHLLQAVLGTLSMHADDQIAFISVTRQMLEATDTVPADTELFINFPRSLRTVKAAVFLKETGNDLVGVSMRAKGEVDVAEVARSFGGGGHRNAAGFKVPAISLATLRQQLLDRLLPLV
ncbi:MAG: bifunctional oligoribonuclease/PAP phosphatase NrnA [Desulfobulbaceae bacterium]|nr:MAG: bifunctional oligoribonuclease/PAP phosphatase NrnA [Desulfobulbaceae bacterium]